MTNRVPTTPLIITNIGVTSDCSMLTICVQLKYPVRLIMNLYKDPPYADDKDPADNVGNRPHRVNWKANVSRVYWPTSSVPQTSFCYTLPWPANRSTFFVQFYSYDNPTKPYSRMPYFAITRQYEIFFYEPWGHSITQNNPWTFVTQPQNRPRVQPGTCDIYYTTLGQSALISCNIPTSYKGTAIRPCNTVVNFSIRYASPLWGNTAYSTFDMSTNQLRTATAYIEGNQDAGVTNDSWYLFTGGAGAFVLTPGDLFANGATPAPNHLAPPTASALFRAIHANIIGGINAGDPTHGTLSLGPISIGVFTGEPVAIRTDWRNWKIPSPYQPVGSVIQ